MNLQFLSGNEMYWHTRYGPSADASHTAYRTLVSYKESWANAKMDPTAEWTGTYRDPRFAPKSQGAGCAGERAHRHDLHVQPHRSAGDGERPAGQDQTLAQHLARQPGARGVCSAGPAHRGLRVGRGPGQRLPTAGPHRPVDDDGNGRPVHAGLRQTDGTDTTTHHVTLYRAASGALVFGAGSVQWTWGLNANHDSPYEPEPADSRMQQAQVNLLADMGAQPTTLASGLVAATKSTDTTGPTVTISSPAAGSSQPNGTQVAVDRDRHRHRRWRRRRSRVLQ